MKAKILIFFLFNIWFNCSYSQADSSSQGKCLNQELIEELKKMVEVDQIAAWVPQGIYKTWTRERWDTFKDSIFRTHKKRIEAIISEFGYPGYNLVGKEGEKYVWLMVQHSDFDSDFQFRVLQLMEAEVKNNNASVVNYCYLMDRVLLNVGKCQMYGTQVTYNSMGQAYPKNLSDSININNRRIAKGLAPLEEYLNQMTTMHYEMNKAIYLNKGISEPVLYNINKE